MLTKHFNISRKIAKMLIIGYFPLFSLLFIEVNYINTVTLSLLIVAFKRA